MISFSFSHVFHTFALVFVFLLGSLLRRSLYWISFKRMQHANEHGVWPGPHTPLFLPVCSPPIHSTLKNEFEDELPVSATVGAILFGSLLISFESQPKIWHHNFGVGRIACCHTVRVLYIDLYIVDIYICVYGVATSWSRQAEQLEISNLLCRLCRAYMI